MQDEYDKLLSRVKTLRTHRNGERRAPHKPLLLLSAIAQLQRGITTHSFDDVKQTLIPLLSAYAPPVKNRHQPELPYWHLVTDGLWVVHGADEMERQKGGFPRAEALRNSSAGLPSDVAEQIQSNPRLLIAVVTALLEEHFAPSTHADILTAVGLNVDLRNQMPDPHEETRYEQRRRDPQFRDHVLRA